MSYSIEASGDNCYPGTLCLINKLGVKDEKLLQQLEADISYAKASMLDQTPLMGDFDFEHYKRIHRFLFEDVYEWAGQVRTVNLSKKGTRFVNAEKIEKLGAACLDKIKNGYLKKISFDLFAERIAELYHDLNMLHPFREGNGRTQRLFFVHLIRAYGYDIDFSNVDTDFLMLATIYAAQGVKDHLVAFFRESIVSQ